MAKKRKISAKELQKRVLQLEALFGQKGISKKLNVSTSSIRNYRKGTTNPNNDIYKKINSLYNKNKKIISTEAIQNKSTKILNKKRVFKPKPQYLPIYPDYMYNSPISEFRESRNFYRLEELHEKGYVAGWFGTKEIPLEVEFLLYGEKLNNIGKSKIIQLVGVVSHEESPKEENNYLSSSASIEEHPVYIRAMRGFKDAKDFETRMEIARDFFLENIKVFRGYPSIFIGFYIREEDFIED